LNKAVFIFGRIISC